MNYQNLNKEISEISFQKKYLYSIFGLYLFSIGTTILGYSIYLLLESLGLVTKSVITWNAQGLFWRHGESKDWGGTLIVTGVH